MLNSESFKRELPTFLAKNWQSDHYKTILEGHEIYLGVKDSCIRFYVKNGVIKTENVPTLCCNHAEADTRTILNMIHADQMTPGDIMIRGSDTDILVLLLHHLHREKSREIQCLDGSGNKKQGIRKIHQCLKDCRCYRSFNVRCSARTTCIYGE